MKLKQTISGNKNLQQAKSARARKAIIDATIKSLVEVGYSETSLSRVAKAAGFSKGALQHHFPSKEDLIAQTLDTLLSRTMPPNTNSQKASSIEEALMRAWKKFVNTVPYRALLDILNAARTNKALQNRISDELFSWGERMNAQSLESYEAVNGDDEEVVMLLNMNRCFMRGLLIQEQYGANSETTIRYLHQWIEMISPLLRLKSNQSTKGG